MGLTRPGFEAYSFLEDQRSLELPALRPSRLLCQEHPQEMSLLTIFLSDTHLSRRLYPGPTTQYTKSEQCTAFNSNNNQGNGDKTDDDVIVIVIAIVLGSTVIVIVKVIAIAIAILIAIAIAIAIAMAIAIAIAIDRGSLAIATAVAIAIVIVIAIEVIAVIVILMRILSIGTCIVMVVGLVFLVVLVIVIVVAVAIEIAIAMAILNSTGNRISFRQHHTNSTFYGTENEAKTIATRDDPQTTVMTKHGRCGWRLQTSFKEAKKLKQIPIWKGGVPNQGPLCSCEQPPCSHRSILALAKVPAMRPERSALLVVKLGPLNSQKPE